MSREASVALSGPSILTINGGSSSIKFALFRPQRDMQKVLSGSIDRIGSSNAALAVKGEDSADNVSATIAASDHTSAVASLIAWMGKRLDRAAPSAIGHRVVHGGPKYWEPQRITPKLIQDLHEFVSYDPEHLPEELQLVEAFRLHYPHLPQIACFDTAFHHDMPRVAAWFKSLPMWLDFGDFRVVHACWHQESIDRLQPVCGPHQRLSEELILRGSRKGSWEFTALETVCKGPEVELPPNISFKDKGGKVRHEVRVRWWQDDLSTYRKAAIGPPGDMDMIPDVPLPAQSRAHPYVGPPVIFGHYWFTGTPKVISPKFACVDYSAAKDGPLVAYRWDGEKELSSDKLEWDGK